MNEGYIFIIIDLVVLYVGFMLTRGKLLGFVAGLDQEQKNPRVLAVYLGWLIMAAAVLVSSTTVLFLVQQTEIFNVIMWNAHTFYLPIAVAAGGFIIHVFANKK